MVKNPVVLAMIAALGWAIAGPLFKLATNGGVKPTTLGFLYGGGLALIAFLFSLQGGQTLFSSAQCKGIVFAVLSGLVGGVAFLALGKAFASPTGYVSVITLITAAYPVVTVFIGLVFFKEAEQVQTWKLIVGSLLVVAGVYLVSTSIVANTKPS